MAAERVAAPASERAARALVELAVRHTLADGAAMARLRWAVETLPPERARRLAEALADLEEALDVLAMAGRL